MRNVSVFYATEMAMNLEACMDGVHLHSLIKGGDPVERDFAKLNKLHPHPTIFLTPWER